MPPGHLRRSLLFCVCVTFVSTWRGPFFSAAAPSSFALFCLSGSTSSTLAPSLPRTPNGPKPSLNHVLVEEIDGKNLQSSILIPEKFGFGESGVARGKVVAVGPTTRPNDITSGRYILFNNRETLLIRYGGKKLRVVHIRDVLLESDNEAFTVDSISGVHGCGLLVKPKVSATDNIENLALPLESCYLNEGTVVKSLDTSYSTGVKYNVGDNVYYRKGNFLTILRLHDATFHFIARPFRNVVAVTKSRT